MRRIKEILNTIKRWLKHGKLELFRMLASSAIIVYGMVWQVYSSQVLILPELWVSIIISILCSLCVMIGTLLTRKALTELNEVADIKSRSIPINTNIRRGDTPRVLSTQS